MHERCALSTNELLELRVSIKTALSKIFKLSDQINVHFMSTCGHKEKREWKIVCFHYVV